MPIGSGGALDALNGDRCNHVKSQFTVEEAGMFVSQHNTYRANQMSSNMVKLVSEWEGIHGSCDNFPLGV